MNEQQEAVETVEKKPVEAAVTEESKEKPVETKEVPKENHDSRRWTRLIRERAEFKAKADLLESELMNVKNQRTQEQAPTKPTLEQFAGDVEKFTDALTDYKLAIAQERETPAPKDDSAKGWKAKETAAQTEYPDYEEVVYEADPLTLPAGVIDAIVTSDLGADIRYLLAKEPAIADKLEGLSEAAAIREIGKIEARIEAEKAAKVKKPAEKKKLPDPISPEKGGSGTVESDLSAEALLRKFQKRESILT